MESSSHLGALLTCRFSCLVLVFVTPAPVVLDEPLSPVCSSDGSRHTELLPNLRLRNRGVANVYKVCSKLYNSASWIAKILKILSSQTSSRCLAFKQVPTSFLVLQRDFVGAQFKVSLGINSFKVNLEVHRLL